MSEIFPRYLESRLFWLPTIYSSFLSSLGVNLYNLRGECTDLGDQNNISYLFHCLLSPVKFHALTLQDCVKIVWMTPISDSNSLQFFSCDISKEPRIPLWGYMYLLDIFTPLIQCITQGKIKIYLIAYIWSSELISMGNLSYLEYYWWTTNPNRQRNYSNSEVSQ